MASLGNFVGHSSARWVWLGRVPRAWIYSASALLRSLLLVGITILVAELLSGPVLYASIAIACALVFILPAYAQARQTDALLQLSLTDSLTGVGNRRALQVRLEEEIARCARCGYSIAVLMIDVDKLKVINDEAGHRAGDEALRLVARALRRSTRISDVVGRLGGDEFLVVAPDTSEEAAYALAERIAVVARRESLAFPLAGNVGLSIGVAAARSSDADPGGLQLLEAADDAMYEAKRRGGDRVVTAGRVCAGDIIPIRPVSGR